MSYRRLLSRSDARRYLAGQTLSLLGDSSMWMACGIWVKSLTGSNGAAGLVFFFFLAPAVAAPLAGLVVDRVRRRPLLVTLNLLGALILVPLFAVQDAGDVWIVYVVMLLYGVVNIAIAPAQSALLHRMLPDDLLASANSALRTAQESLRILAPLAGAGLYAAFGGRAVVILDIITFLAAAAFIVSLSVREPRPGRPDGHVLAGVFDGLRFIRNSPVLRPATIAGIVLTAVIGFSESTTWAVISDGLHRPPEFAGILQLAQGVGAITAGLFAAAAVTRYGETRVAGFGTAVFALGEAFLVVPGLVPVLVGKVLIGGGLPMLIIAVITLLQRSAPDHLQGRVYAGFEVVTTVPQTCSVALGAWMVGVLDYRLVIGLAAIVSATSALMMIRIRRPAEPGEQERSSAPENRLLAHSRTT
ncbi:MAG TPA: MFS transporter [Kribbellaceae bacterium]|nr:MFS transporter [Kribbellaceae bacterium]